MTLELLKQCLAECFYGKDTESTRVATGRGGFRKVLQRVKNSRLFDRLRSKGKVNKQREVVITLGMEAFCKPQYITGVDPYPEAPLSSFSMIIVDYSEEGGEKVTQYFGDGRPPLELGSPGEMQPDATYRDLFEKPAEVLGIPDPTKLLKIAPDQANGAFPLVQFQEEAVYFPGVDEVRKWKEWRENQGEKEDQ